MLESAVNRLSFIEIIVRAGMSAALFKVISAARDFIRVARERLIVRSEKRQGLKYTKGHACPNC